MNPFQIINDAFRGKIDDQYLSKLNGQELAFAMQLRFLPDQITTAVHAAISKDDCNGTTQESACSAEDVLPSGDGNG